MDAVTERCPTKNQQKEILKHLLQLRRNTVQKVAVEVKVQKKIIASMLKTLGEGPKTVPELAEAVGLSPQEAFWWIASLKKYGMVGEGEKRGFYDTYVLANKGLSGSGEHEAS
ncbi:MAG: hypothetical protein WHS46_03125 [Desulfosoma sp.]